MTWLRDFELHFGETGNVSLSADLTGVNRQAVYYHLKRDEELRERVERAMRERPGPKLRIKRH